MYTPTYKLDLSNIVAIANYYKLPLQPAQRGGRDGKNWLHIVGPRGIIYETIHWLCVRLHPYGLYPEEGPQRVARLREAQASGLRKSNYDYETLYWNPDYTGLTLTALELIGVIPEI